MNAADHDGEIKIVENECGKLVWRDASELREAGIRIYLFCSEAGMRLYRHPILRTRDVPRRSATGYCICRKGAGIPVHGTGKPDEGERDELRNG